MLLQYAKMQRLINSWFLHTKYVPYNFDPVAFIEEGWRKMSFSFVSAVAIITRHWLNGVCGMTYALWLCRYLMIVSRNTLSLNRRQNSGESRITKTKMKINRISRVHKKRIDSIPYRAVSSLSLSSYFLLLCVRSICAMHTHTYHHCVCLCVLLLIFPPDFHLPLFQLRVMSFFCTESLAILLTLEYFPVRRWFLPRRLLDYGLGKIFLSFVSSFF